MYQDLSDVGSLLADNLNTETWLLLLNRPVLNSNHMTAAHDAVSQSISALDVTVHSTCQPRRPRLVINTKCSILKHLATQANPYLPLLTTYYYWLFCAIFGAGAATWAAQQRAACSSVTSQNPAGRHTLWCH